MTSIVKQPRSTHYCNVLMGAKASQIISLMSIHSTVYSGTYQRKHESSVSLAFVRGIHRWPVNSPHEGPVTRKMIPLDDSIIGSWLVKSFQHTVISVTENVIASNFPRPSAATMSTTPKTDFRISYYIGITYAGQWLWSVSKCERPYLLSHNYRLVICNKPILNQRSIAIFVSSHWIILISSTFVQQYNVSSHAAPK